MSKYRIEHGDVYEWSEDHNAYIFIYTTTQLKVNTRFKRITMRNVNAAINEIEELVRLEQEDQI